MTQSIMQADTEAAQHQEQSTSTQTTSIQMEGPR